MTRYNVSDPRPDMPNQQIRDLWERNGLPEARYEWLYGASCFATKLCWVLKSEVGEIVGFTGLLRRRTEIASRSLIAGQAIDLVVDRGHRTLGPALMLQRTVIASFAEKGIDFLYGIPNKNSESLVLRIGYKVLGHLERWTKPLESSYIIERYIQNQFVSDSISNLLDIGLKIGSGERSYQTPPGIKSESLATFDQRFDTLWESAYPQFVCIGERTEQYLCWRFLRCPLQEYRIFCVLEGETRLLGYLVYSHRDDSTDIADLLFVDEMALDVLLGEFTRTMREIKRKALSFLYLGSPLVTRRLAHFGFFRRPESARVLVYLNDRVDLFLQAKILNQESWHFTLADTDF